MKSGRLGGCGRSALSSALAVCARAGSDEELQDLKAAYVAAEGDMGRILEAVYFGSVEEEARYRALLEPLVASGALPSFTAFTHEPAKRKAARQKKAGRERAEAEAHAASLNLKTDADLAALIRGRQQSGMADLVARLEAKYDTASAAGSADRKRKGAAAAASAPPPPTDAEFEATQRRLTEQREQRKKKKT